jgi:hypothetical protein
MASDEDFAPEEMDFEPEEPDMDFDADQLEAESAPAPRARTNVYTMLLVVSALFYAIALVATFAEMAPYSTGFVRDLFGS